MGCIESKEPSDSSLEGGRVTSVLNFSLLEELRQRVPCEVIGPDDRGYEKVRRLVWNFDTMGKPAALIRCTTTEDVVAAVQFAATHGIATCVRSAGAHSGHAVVDDCHAGWKELPRTSEL